MSDSGAGLYEALLTIRLQEVVDRLPAEMSPEVGGLINAEAADRVSRHLAQLIARAIQAFPEAERASRAVELAAEALAFLQTKSSRDLGLAGEEPVAPGSVLQAIWPRLPDGTRRRIGRPLTPLLDTTVLTNAPGEPVLIHEIRAEIPSCDGIDVLMAFIRWSGVRGMLDALRTHCQDGKPLRVLTTTYTNSTELRALEELERLGAQVRVSYDTTLTRLHAKAWIFHRTSGYSTAYVGSSNLTHSAQVTGLEWNVRLAEARNSDALSKIGAVFESYWEGGDFRPYERAEFLRRTELPEQTLTLQLSPLEVTLRPFQELLLDQIAVAREMGHRRNLLVAATGTGKTVMAAADYARLRPALQRDRLLFVAHREEILDQSLNTFRQVLRDAAFGEKWVGRNRPQRFQHVFASIQSLNAADIRWIEPDHFDVLIVDEFHHAAAPSYQGLLERLNPRELLGLTATPERADGLDVLRYFDGRIAAELRLWDAIDQQFLVPFDYFGIYDGLDLSEIPWRRGRGYDVEALTNLVTSDHIWARRVIDQVQQKVADVKRHARTGLLRQRAARALYGRSIPARRYRLGSDIGRQRRSRPGARIARSRLRARARGVHGRPLQRGVDVPGVDTLLLLRPTDSATLFLQQLGRGLRKADGKPLCTVLDFVGNHRKEFRYDRRFRALLGGTRSHVREQVEQDFPFLPAGCSIELDPVAQDVVLRSIRNAIPRRWIDQCAELRAMGDVGLGDYLIESGLDLEDVYANNRSWTAMRREVGLPTSPRGPQEDALLRAAGRLLHVDDDERLGTYRSVLAWDATPQIPVLGPRERRLLMMLVRAFPPLANAGSLTSALEELWKHPQVRSELGEIFAVLAERQDHLHPPLDLDPAVPLRAHARYTRIEILAAFESSLRTRTPDWREGVRYLEDAGVDVFAFTLDKTSGGFSPTTRYQDYAISRTLIHWESQSTTSAASPTGQRYIHHAERGTKVLLFARLHNDDRAFWCLGTARYRSHEGDRPIGFVWELDHQLPPDLYTSFAAAVA